MSQMNYGCELWIQTYLSIKKFLRLYKIKKFIIWMENLVLSEKKYINKSKLYEMKGGGALQTRQLQ